MERSSSEDVLLSEVFIPSSESVLSWEEVEHLQALHGKNVLAFQQPLTWYRVLLQSVAHPFNALLAVLATISGATQDYYTLTLLLLMVVLSIALRFVQELKSEKAAQGLKHLVNNTVTVIRQYKPNVDPENLTDVQMNCKQGYEYDISMEDIVVGDLVKFSAGNMIPGDVLLLESKDLFISQSALTGEALPIEKFVMSEKEIAEAIKVPKMERSDMCFMGTSVVSGTAVAKVVAIGSNTVFGEMARELAKKRPPNAFAKGIKRISYMFLVIMAIMTPIVFLISGLLQKGWLESFLFAVAVAVGLTPGMLPMIVNANLARGALVMARKRTIVKDLEAIVNFGAIDVLCTDKTGTLTQDKVVLIQHVNPEGKFSKLPLETAFLNSYFQTGLRNLLDVAVLEYFKKMRINDSDLEEIEHYYTKIDEIPFDFVRRRMSVILEKNTSKERILISKGAVDEMLRVCNKIQMSSDMEPTIIESSEALKGLCDRLNQEGLRVLAVAYKILSENMEVKEEDMCLVGFVAFLDPPKETTAPAIKELRAHNIAIKVLTGDSPLVCKNVCEQVNLPVDEIVTSADLQGLTDDELAEVAERGTIFAKLTPLEKAKVVQILKRKHVVGFLGDGINDAPALREADVGISVDSAVDVAKESAQIILLEKSLLVLVKAVITGRVTYGNTLKYIKMAVSSNFGNVFSVLIASAWLPFLPMLPTQIVLQNLLYDISQIAIPWDHMDSDWLITPKTWSAKDVVRFMVILGPVNSLFDVCTFCIMWYYFGCQTDAQQSMFQTAWFVENLVTQTLIVHMIRSEKTPIFQTNASLPVLLGTFGVIVVSIAIPFIPGLNSSLNMVPLPGMYFPFLIGMAVVYFFLTQLVKRIYFKIFQAWI